MADRSAPEKRAGPPAFHLKQVNVLGGTALCGQRAVPPRPFSVKAKGQRGRGLRGPCTLRQGAVPLASRMANRQQAETKQYPPGWEGKFASSWAGENVAMGRKKTRFLPAHCRIFPARFARLRPALPAAQERHWTAPEDGSRVQWTLVRGLGAKSPQRLLFSLAISLVSRHIRGRISPCGKCAGRIRSRISFRRQQQAQRVRKQRRPERRSAWSGPS